MMLAYVKILQKENGSRAGSCHCGRKFMEIYGMMLVWKKERDENVQIISTPLWQVMEKRRIRQRERKGDGREMDRTIEAEERWARCGNSAQAALAPYGVLHR